MAECVAVSDITIKRYQLWFVVFGTPIPFVAVFVVVAYGGVVDYDVVIDVNDIDDDMCVFINNTEAIDSASDVNIDIRIVVIGNAKLLDDDSVGAVEIGYAWSTLPLIRTVNRTLHSNGFRGGII